MVKRRKWVEWWEERGAFFLAAVFVVVFTWLMVCKHNSFHTFALDLAKFDQAIWNTLHGRFLFSTLQNQSILANHFSPFMAFLAPLFLIWSDVRVLFFVQMLAIAIAGLWLYQIVRLKHRQIAPWFLLAFYLNPALHEVALVEFRRVTLAMPFLALASYALYTRKRWLMVVGLMLALLCKEDMALIVLMTGVYLVLLERDWKWGVPLIVVGAAWAVVVTFWVVSAFIPKGDNLAVYPQMNTFCLEGDTYGEMLAYLMRDPMVLFRRMFDQTGLAALWRVLLPVGLILPFLALDWFLIILPSMAYMLMSCMGMHQLTGWYMASVLPGLFAALAVGLNRRSEQWARRLVVLLMGTTLVGYALFSYAPLGAKYDPSLYKVTEHDRIAAAIVDAVPEGASVAAQDPYVPHLAHREHIYLYPWVAIDLDRIGYIVLDRQLHSYPLQPYKLDSILDDLIADTSYTIELEADGAFLFHHNGEPLPAFSVQRTFDGTMLLDRVEIAVPDERGFYRPTAQEPVLLKRGQPVRISLYWEALAAPEAERTISVRILDRSGIPIVLHDNMPGQGKKPTSWWREGWKIRDVYYLDLPPTVQPGEGTVAVLVYDSHTSEMVPSDEGSQALVICAVDIR
jgi:uncharacterized membrane protein